LPANERFWPASMPCILRGHTNIPIAQYGSSNIGRMKNIYRRGLAYRYGSVMQTIAGIHFNYSFSDDFWQTYHGLISPDLSLRYFIDNHYMGITKRTEIWLVNSVFVWRFCISL